MYCIDFLYVLYRKGSVGLYCIGMVRGSPLPYSFLILPSDQFDRVLSAEFIIFCTSKPNSRYIYRSLIMVWLSVPRLGSDGCVEVGLCFAIRNGHCMFRCCFIMG